MDLISDLTQERTFTTEKGSITLDVAEPLSEIDDIRKRIGVDRGALIKIWLHERVKEEKMAGAFDSCLL